MTKALAKPFHTGCGNRQLMPGLKATEGLDILYMVRGVWTHLTLSSSAPQPCNLSHYTKSQWFDKNEFLSFGIKVKHRNWFLTCCGYESNLNSLIGEKRLWRIMPSQKRIKLTISVTAFFSECICFTVWINEVEVTVCLIFFFLKNI